MTHDREVLKVECTLAIARCIEADPLVTDPWGFACAMFFSAVDTLEAAPRRLAEVEADLLAVRERNAHMVAPPHPNFAGDRHAHHRPGTDPTTPARRKADAEDAALAADLEAEARRARDRDRAQRAAAHPHPWE